MIIEPVVADRFVYIRVDPEEDLLEALQRGVSEAGIRHGAILAGVGSLRSFSYHVVSKPVLPTDNAFVEGDGPFDILTITGAVLDGRVHAHVTFSDTEKAMGGHLEPGSRVLTFALAVIADTSAMSMANWDHVGPLSDIR